MRDGAALALDEPHRARAAHGLSEEAREEPHTGVQVQDTVAGPRLQPVEHRRDQDLGGAGVDLPEAVRGDGELHAADGVQLLLGDPATTVDQAVVDLDDRVAAVLAHAAAAVAEVDVALPGAPPQPVEVAGHGLDLDVDLQAGQAQHLLAHHRRLEPALGGQRDVLQVAATAQPRPGEGARRLDAVRRGLEHLDGVTAPEPVALGTLGHLDDDPLARQRVPDEDDRAVLLAQHAVPAVRHRPHDALDARPHGAHRSRA